MTKKRTKEPWMSGAEYGRRMPPFTVNLIVADLARSLRFYTEVLGAQVEYQDEDFAALRLAGLDFMLHADHTYDHHGLYKRLPSAGKRGAGAELRLMGVDPDGVQQRAQPFSADVVQAVGDRGHGWRDVIVADPDGYIWAVGVVLDAPVGRGHPTVPPDRHPKRSEGLCHAGGDGGQRFRYSVTLRLAA